LKQLYGFTIEEEFNTNSERTFTSSVSVDSLSYVPEQLISKGKVLVVGKKYVIKNQSIIGLEFTILKMVIPYLKENVEPFYGIKIKKSTILSKSDNVLISVEKVIPLMNVEAGFKSAVLCYDEQTDSISRFESTNLILSDEKVKDFEYWKDIIKKPRILSVSENTEFVTVFDTGLKDLNYVRNKVMEKEEMNLISDYISSLPYSLRNKFPEVNTQVPNPFK
jgi:hypothetical protein